jgi:hypothetical protein
MPLASSALVTQVFHAEPIIGLASSVEISEAFLTDPAILLDGIALLAIGVVYFHDEEVEDGEGLELDVASHWPVSHNCHKGAVVT